VRASSEETTLGGPAMRLETKIEILGKLIRAERELDRSRNSMTASTFTGRIRTEECLTLIKALRAELDLL